MGLAEWKEKYYPVPAADAEDEVAHSLQKWEGLRELKQYGLTQAGFTITDGTDSLTVNDQSCALCIQFPGCPCCPLYEARDYTSCDVPKAGETYAPYSAWTLLGDPEPMIKALNALIP